MTSGLGLDIALITTGLVLVFLVWSFAPVAPARRRCNDFVPLPDPQDTESCSSSQGRIEYMNGQARQWFALAEDEPAELERLTRRVRPVDDFLDVCAAPAQKRITVNGKLLEATSYQVPGEYPLVLVSFRPMDLAPGLAASAEATSSILKVVTDFSQSITASLDLQNTLYSVLDNAAAWFQRMPWNCLGCPDTNLIAYRFRGLRGA
jgi:hypothetical protein